MEAAPAAPPDEELTVVLRAVATSAEVTADTIAGHLVAVYKALNEYTLAKYRTALKRDQFRRLVYQYAGMGV